MNRNAAKATMILMAILAAPALAAPGADAPVAFTTPATPATTPAIPTTPATDPSATGPEARIPFADHGGIWNWQVVDDKTVLIQDRSRKWYKATLFVTCIDLPFVERLGFESNADGTFDKFSSIRTRQQRCPLASLVPTAAPAKKSKAKKPDAAPAASAPAAQSP